MVYDEDDVMDWYLNPFMHDIDVTNRNQYILKPLDSMKVWLENTLMPSIIAKYMMCGM